MTDLAPLDEVLTTLRSPKYYSARSRRFFDEKHIVDVWVWNAEPCFAVNRALATDRKTFEQARRMLRKEGLNIRFTGGKEPA